MPQFCFDDWMEGNATTPITSSWYDIYNSKNLHIVMMKGLWKGKIVYSGNADAIWYDHWLNNPITTTTTSATGTYYDYNARPRVVYTPEELAAQEVRRKEAEARARISQRQVKEAIERAEGLLLQYLSKEQKETFRRARYFDVIGCSTKTRYRIHCKPGVISANIHVMEPSGRVTHRLCAHLPGRHQAPAGDHWLMQKLFLETDEFEVLRIANRHPA